jgi:hypothetical protein
VTTPSGPSVRDVLNTVIEAIGYHAHGVALAARNCDPADLVEMGGEDAAGLLLLEEVLAVLTSPEDAKATVLWRLEVAVRQVVPS